MNRLLRRYLPKGMTVPWNTGNEVMDQQIDDLKNSKARMILGYCAPDELVKEWVREDAAGVGRDHGLESGVGSLISCSAICCGDYDHETELQYREVGIITVNLWRQDRATLESDHPPAVMGVNAGQKRSMGREPTGWREGEIAPNFSKFHLI